MLLSNPGRCASVQLIRIEHIVLVCLNSTANSHRLGAQTAEIYFLTVLEAGSVRFGKGHVWVLVTACFLDCGGPCILLYLCFVGVEWPRGEAFCPVTFLFWGIILIMIFLASCPRVNKITAQRSCLPMSPQRVLGLQYRHGGDS